MARHNDILDQFKNFVDEFDFRNSEHLDTVCFIHSSATNLIKFKKRKMEKTYTDNAYIEKIRK